MSFLSRFVVAMAVLGLATNCSSNSILDAYTSAVPPVNGHVYLIRGLVGEVFSRGLDDLAEKINRRGLGASVHGLFSANSLTEEIIKKYKTDPSSAPIILLGHSSGGDAIITMAERMKEANVPVGIAFGFDPTPLAGRVPDNVELFVNLYQKTNPIGGGVVKPAEGFRGRLINIDLREHSEIIHITLDKSSTIHDLIVNEIMDFISTDGRNQFSGAAALSLSQTKYQRPTPVSLPSPMRPFILDYLVPRSEPIEIWDSGLQITARAGENLQSIAGNYRVPVWLVAQVNSITPDSIVQPGKVLTIPQRMSRADRSAIDVGAAR